MSLVKEVKRAIEVREEILEEDTSFQELKKFYEEMLKDGYVVKQEYTLPPLDTIGHQIIDLKSINF